MVIHRTPKTRGRAREVVRMGREKIENGEVMIFGGGCSIIPRLSFG